MCLSSVAAKSGRPVVAFVLSLSWLSRGKRSWPNLILSQALHGYDSSRMLNAVPTFGVMSRAVHRSRYLPNLGNDIPLVCSYKGQHEICTCVLMLQPLVAWLPLAKLGRLHFWRLVRCRSK